MITTYHSFIADSQQVRVSICDTLATSQVGGGRVFSYYSRAGVHRKFWLDYGQGDEYGKLPRRIYEMEDAVTALADRGLTPYTAALFGGLVDVSYNNVCCGSVLAYHGCAIVEIEGKKFSVKGHYPKATPQHISKQGFYEILELSCD